jgi:hypothetical protein
MFFLNYYIDFSPNSNINLISSYKNIRNKFILLYIKNKNNLYLKNNFTLLYLDALVYSKYYLYWKIYGCVYSEEIMNLLYDIEFIK